VSFLLEKIEKPVESMAEIDITQGESLRLTAPEVMQGYRRLFRSLHMRRIFVSLCALAVAVPVLAQEKAPAPTPAPATVTTTTSNGKTGLFSRKYRNSSVQAETPVTTTTSATTTTTTMEPVYTSRGKIRRYRTVNTNTSTATPATPAPMPAPATSPVAQTSGTTDSHSMSKSESSMVQPTSAEPMSEPTAKRGLFSRLGLKK
jgi:hypothetical protein